MYITKKLHTKNAVYYLDRVCAHILRHLYGYATGFTILADYFG